MATTVTDTEVLGGVGTGVAGSISLASLVAVADTADHFAGTNVETILAELAVADDTGAAATAQVYADLAATTGAGLVGFSSALSYAAGTVGKWLTDLITTAGAGVIGFSQSVAYAAGTVGAFLKNEIHVMHAPYNAVGDNTTSCDAAFAAAITAALSSGKTLVIGPGTFKFTSASTTVWDLTGYETLGLVVKGAGPGRTILNFSGVSSSIGLHIYATSDWYDCIFQDFKVIGSTSTALVAVGKNDYSDPCNVARFQNVVVLNSLNNSSAEGLRLNYVVNSNFIGCRANAYSNGSGTNEGMALRCRQAAFNTFTNGSYGNGEFGVRFTDGYNYGNVFNAVDVENIDYGVSTESANSGNNTFVGGQFSLWEQACFRTTGSLSTNAITVINFNSGDDDSDPVIDATNYGGIRIIDGTPVATPAVPATTVTVTNTSGKRVLVTYWGGVASQCTISGFGVALAEGSVVVPHGGTISLTYTVAPQWYWQALE